MALISPSTTATEERPLRQFTMTAVFLGIMAWAIAQGSSYALFFDVPSLVVVLGGTWALVMARHSYREIREFTPQVGETFVNGAYISGFLGTFIGLVQLLDGVHDITTMGPTMAVVMLPNVYALALVGLGYALKSELQTAPQKILLGNGFMYLLPLLCFFGLLLSYSDFNRQ